MTGWVFAAVLCAAALHAAWNAVVRAATDTRRATALVGGGAAALSAVLLPFCGAVAPAAWPFIAASVAVHFVYFALIARAYRVAPMTLAYPVMRGLAPGLVAGAGVLLLGERLSWPEGLGVALLCGGILLMARGRVSGAGVGVAAVNAVVIATYTLIDGNGVRRSGSPLGYDSWVFLLTGAPMLLRAMAGRRDDWRDIAPRAVVAGLAGGVSSVLSYGIVLWAMTRAPVAIVAALRETAILFGVLISALVLGERPGVGRMAAAVLIAAGAMLLA